MNENNESKKFVYTYSPREMEEVENIRKKYSFDNSEPSKLEQLRRLHKSVTKSGTIAALILGVIGTLIFGTGMSLIMVWGDRFFTVGIATGIIGTVIAAAAYPVYVKVVNKKKEKIAPIILSLANEISNM